MPIPMLLLMCFPKDKKITYKNIGAPYAISHDFHVRYNFELARYEIHGDGPHPRELISNLIDYNMHQHFNVPITQIPRVLIPLYEERIPAVLLMLQHQFENHDGYNIPYIFRESPGKIERDRAIIEINTGKFHGDNIKDVRIVADLIKVWFRQLPIPLLNDIPLNIMENINNSKNDINEYKKYLGIVELSILQWLADILIRVSLNENKNHMGIEQLAIILAPNLIRIDTPNPMVAVTLSKASVDFLRLFLYHRRISNSIT